MHWFSAENFRRGGVALGVALLVSINASAQSSTNWSVAVLDRILAGVQPGQKLAQVGDMQIRVSNLQTWRNELAGQPMPQLAFDGAAPTWPGGTVYYTFDGSVSGPDQKVFLDGVNEWAMFANLRAVARTTQANYITIQELASLEGGQSAVGMVGGQQFLSIGPTSWNRPTVCHEFGHTLGLVHEHQRSNRDSYVVILTNNIAPGEEGNFVLLSNSLNQGPYDFLSIMHYNRNSFAVNPALDTIEPRPAFAQFLNLMGQQFDPVLSAADRAGMAAIYGSGPPLSGVVTNTRDSGPGSLRVAIYYAFDHPGATIRFNLPTNDPGFANHVFTIQPTDQFPSLVNAAVLDGSTQTNFNPSGPAIQINGALAPPPSVFPNGLRLGGSNCLVRSLIINGFAASGIVIDGTNATGNTVAGCYLGVDPSGTTAVTNGFSPVTIDNGASGNTIGGTNAAARNIISGSAYQGLVIRDPGTRSNRVWGNYIGLTASGTAALSNTWSGVAIYNGAQSNFIGGTLPGTRNIISGNGFQGVVISDADSAGNVIEGNYIGLNPAGTVAIPNGWSGVNCFGGAHGNVIGGTAAGAGNVISGNTYEGVLVQDPGSSNNAVQGNYVGLNAAGTGPVPNLYAGVQISEGTAANVVGGTLPAMRNVISGNGGQGVLLADTGTSNNLVQGNLIGLNPAGTDAISNNWSGVEIYHGPQGNLIGGPTAGAGNVISGNGNYGVFVHAPATSGNLVQGNFIGVNENGNAALPNAYAGVGLFDSASSNVIGGTLPGTGDLISGNSGQGVAMADLGTTGNLLQGNVIGLDATGANALPNHGWAGIDIFNSAQANLIGGGVGVRNIISGNSGHGISLSGGATAQVVEGNTIGLDAASKAAVPNGGAGLIVFGNALANQLGGAGLGAGNFIADNLSGGVQMYDVGTSNNAVRGNSMFGNSGPGISLYTGANGSAPAPVLASAVLTTSLTVTGNLTSLPSTTFHLDFYASPPPLASAQARTYLGTKDVTTSGGGTAGFAAILGAVVPIGQIITGTATDPAGNTSPLSAGVAVTAVDSVGDGIPDAWRAAHFGGSGTTTNSQSCATCDPDHDGVDNLHEFFAGTNPTNAASVLRISGLTVNGADLTLSFQSATGIVYRVEAENALSPGGWSVLLEGVLGTGGPMQVTDPGVAALPEQYYRLGVEP